MTIFKPRLSAVVAIITVALTAAITLSAHADGTVAASRPAATTR